MPSFDQAQVAETVQDVEAYRKLIKPLKVGSVVTLPLTPDDTTRKVMRVVNRVGDEYGMRIMRLASAPEVVRFKVLSPHKRSINMTAEQRRERVAKARETRMRNRMNGKVVVAAV